jgi:hypothetical protein
LYCCLVQYYYYTVFNLWRCNSGLYILWLFFCLGQNKWLNGQALIHDHTCNPFCTNSTTGKFWVGSVNLFYVSDQMSGKPSRKLTFVLLFGPILLLYCLQSLVFAHTYCTCRCSVRWYRACILWMVLKMNKGKILFWKFSKLKFIPIPSK